jgi:hypothetical protein
VPAEFRPDRILEVLDRHGVRFVLIGGLAATAHGSPMITADVDIAPSRDRKNLERLSAAMTELDANIRVAETPEGTAFEHDAESLARLEVLNLVTSAGDLDVAFIPAGTAGYDDLRRDAVPMTLLGIPIDVASLADVVRSKEAAGRLKDLAAIPVLRRLLEAEEDKGDA